MCVRVREEFGTSALEPVASKFEQVGVVGEGERLGGILFDDEHRESLGLQHCQGFEDDLDKPRREAERGFIEEHQAGLDHQAAGNRNHLLLPARHRSGKSTVFRLISGEIPADSGEIHLRGTAITQKSASVINRLGLSRTFQLSRLYPQMTATENLVAVTRAPEGEAFARARDSLDFVGLSPVADEFAANLSYGQQKLLEFARVLVNDPDVILLDEPFAGVNPVMEERLCTHIHALREQGKTFLITDHEIKLIMALCSRLIVLDHGELLADGEPAVIRADPRVIDAYFGT
ncbi:MAG: ATP-binding cassette domain-containing protein [Proteobacteria bacterium]|nr:ATP-binding cassette domain-containing protein [Pseudomonadota bacterium]